MQKIKQPIRMNVLQELKKLKNVLPKDFGPELLKATEDAYEAARRYNDLVEVLKKAQLVSKNK